MERLTERDEYGNADIIALSDMMPEIYAELSFGEANSLTDALNRLAAYEDTGLTPEKITELKSTYAPPNDPLTLEELREMDGETVWDARWSVWGILDTGLCCVFTRKGDIDLNEALAERRLYRRKPEEDT